MNLDFWCLVFRKKLQTWLQRFMNSRIVCYLHDPQISILHTLAHAVQPCNIGVGVRVEGHERFEVIVMMVVESWRPDKTIASMIRINVARFVRISGLGQVLRLKLKLDGFCVTFRLFVDGDCDGVAGGKVVSMGDDFVSAGSKKSPELAELGG